MNITNFPVLQGESVVPWPDALVPASLESTLIYSPEWDWTYSHHPHLVHFCGHWLAIWSNAEVDEDSSGQRVLMASSPDFSAWSRPEVLAQPSIGPDGRPNVLTAAGFHVYNDVLVCYFAEYGPTKLGTNLWAVTSHDGVHFNDRVSMEIPVCPNFGPQLVHNGRLIICGNMSFPYTDDPSGLTGWQMSGIYPPVKITSDDPASFWEVSEKQGWSAGLCEGSFIVAPGGQLIMLLRAAGVGHAGRLWVTTSDNNGESWSPPQETSFTDNNAKFHLGRLPDGRYYYVGNPTSGARCPLVLSLSDNGTEFNRHYVLGTTPYPMKRDGLYKEGEYGYPQTVVYDGHFHCICSRRKEGVEVIRFNLDDVE
jgi:hypothetical protein